MEGGGGRVESGGYSRCKVYQARHFINRLPGLAGAVTRYLVCVVSNLTHKGKSMFGAPCRSHLADQVRCSHTNA